MTWTLRTFAQSAWLPIYFGPALVGTECGGLNANEVGIVASVYVDGTRPEGFKLELPDTNCYSAETAFGVDMRVYIDIKSNSKDDVRSEMLKLYVCNGAWLVWSQDWEFFPLFSCFDRQVARGCYVS